MPYPDAESLGNYHYVLIQSQPTEEAVVLEPAAGGCCWQHAGMAGRTAVGRGGWLLKRPIHVSRRGGTRADAHCDADLPVAMQQTQSSCM